MRWYHYLALFFAGVFLANSVPHFRPLVSYAVCIAARTR